ncbi:YdcF family protein [Gordonia sp. WA4-43]|nr:YdcF family protein [Gordonia sp. WA4-43]
MLISSWMTASEIYRDVPQDPLRRADAIIVLGGEHDGREGYGLELAGQGYASTVLISDPYRPYSPDDAALMSRVCGANTDEIEVICQVPSPSTTQGEALMVQELAVQRGWQNVIVVTWEFHIPRARYIFDQCFDGDVIMRAVPRSYDRPPWRWAYTYVYQTTAFAKAAIIGCD